MPDQIIEKSGDIRLQLKFHTTASSIHSSSKKAKHSSPAINLNNWLS